MNSIKKMKKEDLVSLLNKTAEDCNKIRSSVQFFEQKQKDIDDAYLKINGEDGFISQIESTASKATEKIEAIKKVYNEICEDADEENLSIKNQLDELVKGFNEDKKKLNDFKNTVFGYQKTNASGEKEEIPGLSHDINSFYRAQQEKYNKLFKQIEEELSSGATSINLSKSFADKVKEYNRSSLVWSVAFIFLVASAIIYYGIVTFSSAEVKNIKDVLLPLYYRLPFLVFVTWLSIFFGNRRAESKKLEESYKHKEVLARSFTGYKKTLEDINDTDKELLKEHMNNLLKAINKDSGAFLSSKGEKVSFLEHFKAGKEKSNIKKQD